MLVQGFIYMEISMERFRKKQSCKRVVSHKEFHCISVSCVLHILRVEFNRRVILYTDVVSTGSAEEELGGEDGSHRCVMM